jgi:DNA polymerase I-like protein with 3'-5' exonuclease and polymerase domains
MADDQLNYDASELATERNTPGGPDKRPPEDIRFGDPEQPRPDGQNENADAAAEQQTCPDGDAVSEPQPPQRRHEQFLQLARRYIIPATNKVEGLRFGFDTEANGLLNAATKAHCIAIADLDRDETADYGPGQINDALAHLSRADYLAGHNIVGYDLPLLRRLYGWTPSQGCVVVDTLIVSRLIFPHLADLDRQAAAMGDPPLGKLTGRHSLEAWGMRLGIPKTGTDIDAWATWTAEIQERCIGDARRVKLLWLLLQPDGQAAKALALEQRVAPICDEISAAGIPFDTEDGERQRDQWMARHARLEAKLHTQFPEVTNWNSRQQIAALLEKRGWVPDRRTEKTGQPKIDDELLESLPQLYPEFEGLAEYYLLGRRLGQLSEGEEAWLRHVGPDGRIHGSIVHIGTPHSRASHFGPNIAQVPNPKKGKPLAAECRALFRARNDWVFVSCDQSGLQDRAFAHYLAEFDGGAYARAFLAGLDPHWATAKSLTLVPVTAVRDKENKLHTALREGCKSWRYGFLFGMRAPRAGTILYNTIKAAEVVDPACGLMAQFFGTSTHPGENALKRVGQHALDSFIAATPGLSRLREHLQMQVMRAGWLPGLDGRRVPVDAQYKALNYALASAEAVICKRWIANVHDELCARFRYGWDDAVGGGDAVIVAWVHDELVVCCRPEIADQVGDLMVYYAKEAGEHYGLRCALDAEYSVGHTWAGEGNSRKPASV